MLTICRIERMDYMPAWELQRQCVGALRGSGRDTAAMILVEHPPVITIGRGGTETNILASAAALSEAGVEVHETNRGGDVTYHGPGQIVGYPIVPLKFHGRDVHRYLRALEVVLIASLGDYEIPAFRREGLTGVWTPAGKIASIGVAISHWITSHGFALNVDPNLKHFHLIHPCGMADISMVSMRTFLDHPPARAAVEDAVIRHFCAVFGFDKTAEATPGELCEALT